MVPDMQRHATDVGIFLKIWAQRERKRCYIWRGNLCLLRLFGTIFVYFITNLVWFLISVKQAQNESRVSSPSIPNFFHDSSVLEWTNVSVHLLYHTPVRVSDFLSGHKLGGLFTLFPSILSLSHPNTKAYEREWEHNSGGGRVGGREREWERSFSLAPGAQIGTTAIERQGMKN